MKKYKIIQKEFNYREWLFENDRYEREKLKTLLSLIPKTGKILEVGCGYGFLSFLMLSKGREVFAADIVKGIAKKPLSKGVVFKKISKGKFPFENNTFDCVISTDVIEHVLDESSLVEECWRVLKKEGEIIIATPNIYRLSFWMKTLVLKKPKFPSEGNFDPIFGTDQHLREYDKKTLLTLFEKNSWGNIKILGYGLGVRKLPSFLGLIPSPLDFFCNYFIATAEKH
ncbi:class I SAM-dependent methyltransferase [Patescibacteria group bacterium]|nr:class I SAM-dependent methyltransferase [Patescibacteria group bacterium]